MIRDYVFLCLALVALAITAPMSRAHELRPAALVVQQVEAQEFDVTWRVPARGDLRLAMDVRFDNTTRALSAPRARFANGYYDERWRISHPNQLVGSRIEIDGLARTLTDVLVRLRWLDGREQVTRLLPDSPAMQVEEKAGNRRVALTYFVLGVEHILLGIDHLLFVLALVMLATGWKSLLVTITAFTAAHSVTLAAAVLGLVSVPQGPVEAVIALSIVFVASEILHKYRASDSLAIRHPALVAFAFGLLHGLGFAGALADIGVPQHAIPLSLAMFNIGVEAGQLLFVAGLCSIVLLLRQWPAGQQWQPAAGPAMPMAVGRPVAYLVGAIATWWLIERSLMLVI